ncbi:MAG: tetratricopeptide repeat protein [Bacteroidota bacterium]
MDEAINYLQQDNHKKSINKAEKAYNIAVTKYNDSTKAGSSLNLIGLNSLYSENYEQALFYFLQAEDLITSSAGHNLPELGSIYDNIALTYENLNVPDSSEFYFKKAFEFKESRLGPMHPETGNTAYYMGLFYREQGEPDKAVEKLERALMIREDMLGPDNENLLMPVEILIDLNAARSDYEEAEKYLRQKLSILINKHGKYSRELLPVLNQFKQLFKMSGNRKKEFSIDRSIIRVQENLDPVDSVSLAYAYHDLAGSLAQDSLWDEAVYNYKQAYRAFKRLGGKYKKHALAAANNLGELYRSSGQLDEAIEHYNQITGSEELKVTGIEGAHIYNNLGTVYFFKGKNDEALEALKKGLKYTAKNTEQERLLKKQILLNIASVYHKMGDKEEAARYYHRAQAL